MTPGRDIGGGSDKHSGDNHVQCASRRRIGRGTAMARRYVRWHLVLTIMFGSFGAAQANLSSVSFHVGLIRGIATPLHRPYPEVRIGGLLGYPILEWSAQWGYWDDGVTEVLITDMVIYSYSGHIIGSRVTLYPGRTAAGQNLPIALFAGVSRQLLTRTYVGGEGYFGGRGSHGREGVTTLEAGGEIYFPLAETVELRGEVRQFFSWGTEYVNRAQEGRRAYTVGFAIRM